MNWSSYLEITTLTTLCFQKMKCRCSPYALTTSFFWSTVMKPLHMQASYRSSCNLRSLCIIKRDSRLLWKLEAEKSNTYQLQSFLDSYLSNIFLHRIWKIRDLIFCFLFKTCNSVCKSSVSVFKMFHNLFLVFIHLLLTSMNEWLTVTRGSITWRSLRNL